MNIQVNFLALHSELPKTYTAVEVPEGTDAQGLLRIVSQIYKDQFKEYTNGGEGQLKDVIVASNHEMLQMEDKLFDGQKVTIIGQIIGG